MTFVSRREFMRLVALFYPAAAAAAVAPTVVNVINTSAAPASVRRRKAKDGSEEIEVIIEAVARDIRAGGRVGRAIDKTRGARQLGTVR